MNRKELSAVIIEAAARTEAAAALIGESVARTEAARAGIEVARRRQEEAVARQEAAIAAQEATRKKTEEMFHDFMRRTDKVLAEDRQWGKRVFAELADQRDERRALIEALLQAIDRLPPPPPHLRSA